MKLLICTQVVDKDHSVLGFFHRWIEEFAKHYQTVHVICLQEGKHDLPDNVHVYSLGKEAGQNRFKYIYRFYKYSWFLRKDYDAVFVHMNQIYVILGAVLWRIWNKKIGLWYMHKSVTASLRIAEKLTHRIFTASKESFRLKSKKLVITGHGIDTELFEDIPDCNRDIDLLTVGRLSPSKNFETAIETLAIVRKQIPVTLTIIGGASSPSEQVYERKLKSIAKEKGLEQFCNFVGPVKHSDLPGWLVCSKVFLHTATNGSLDKALLEPIMAGVPVVSSSEAANDLPLVKWQANSVEGMADIVVKLLLPNDIKNMEELRNYVIKHHSLTSLVPKIKKIFSPGS